MCLSHMRISETTTAKAQTNFLHHLSCFALRLAGVLCFATALWNTCAAYATNTTSQENASSQLARLAATQFEEPLIRTAPTAAEEDAALLKAITTYREQGAADDLRAFDAFLARFPHSGWRIALFTNFGLTYYHYGYFSKAIEAWEQAWQAGQALTEPTAKALTDRAIGELVRMHARLGHADRLAALLQDIGNRPVSGPATEAVDGAKQGIGMKLTR